MLYVSISNILNWRICHHWQYWTYIGFATILLWSTTLRRHIIGVRPILKGLLALGAVIGHIYWIWDTIFLWSTTCVRPILKGLIALGTFRYHWRSAIIGQQIRYRFALMKVLDSIVGWVLVASLDSAWAISGWIRKAMKGSWYGSSKVLVKEKRKHFTTIYTALRATILLLSNRFSKVIH